MVRADKASKTDRKNTPVPKNSGEKTPTPETTNPRNLGLSILDKIQDFNLPDPPTDSTKFLEYYGGVWEKLCALDPGFSALTMAQSELYWLQGTLLNLLYHIDPAKRNNSSLTREESGDFKALYLKNLSNDTLEDRRHVADRFGRFEARQKTYSDMAATCDQERAIARGKKPSTTKKPSRTKPPESKTKTPITIANVEKKFTTVEEHLAHLLTLPKARDLYDNPRETLDILDGLEADLKTIATWLKKFEAERQKLRRAIEKTMAKTRFASSKKAKK